MLQRHNIHFYTTDNPDIEAAVIERFNKTLKSKKCTSTWVTRTPWGTSTCCRTSSTRTTTLVTDPSEWHPTKSPWKTKGSCAHVCIQIKRKLQREQSGVSRSATPYEYSQYDAHTSMDRQIEEWCSHETAAGSIYNKKFCSNLFDGS